MESSMKNRNIVLEPTRFTEHEDVEYVFGTESRRSSIWSPNFVVELEDRLREMQFDPEHDHVVIVGHMVNMVILTSVLVRLYGGFQALMWNAVDRNYVLRKIGEPHVARV
jgi:hypothetical protein